MINKKHKSKDINKQNCFIILYDLIFISIINKHINNYYGF